MLESVTTWNPSGVERFTPPTVTTVAPVKLLPVSVTCAGWKAVTAGGDTLLITRDWRPPPRESWPRKWPLFASSGQPLLPGSVTPSSHCPMCHCVPLLVGGLLSKEIFFTSPSGWGIVSGLG